MQPLIKTHVFSIKFSIPLSKRNTRKPIWLMAEVQIHVTVLGTHTTPSTGTGR